MTTDASELEAIVAHGLLNSLAVLSGAAGTLLAYGASMEEEDVATLVTAIDEQSGMFTEGLKVLLEHSSVAFADAATAVSLGAAVCGSLSAERRAAVLTTLVKRSKELKTALDGLVRGLPPDVLELLDSLAPTAETGSSLLD
jgi:K+-sensing histidine kinase KdpD